MRWINNYANKSTVKKIPLLIKLSEESGLKLKAYAEAETKTHNFKVSKSSIIETLLNEDKGFRQTVIPEQEAYANTQERDDKDSSKTQ